MIQNTTALSGTTINATSGGLYGMTIATGAVISVGHVPNHLVVQSNLVLNGKILYDVHTGGSDPSRTLEFSGTQTISGTGSIEVLSTNTGDNNSILLEPFNVTLTVGSGITVKGTALTFGNSSTGGNTVLLNQGTIDANTSGAAALGITINTTYFTNALGAKVLLSDSTKSLTLNPFTSWLNQGTITTTGGTLNLSGASWSNTGTITDNGLIVNLAGAFTQFGMGVASPQAGQGTFTRTAGTVNLIGTLSGNLNLNDTTGNWLLGGGTLKNGALNTSGAAKLIGVNVANGGPSYLQNATINGVLDLTTASTSIYVTGGLTVDTTLKLGDAAGLFSSQWSVRDDQTWAGTGDIVFGGYPGNAVTGGGSSLTIAAGLTVHGQWAWFNTLSELTVLGTLSADVSGGAIRVSASTFTNRGTVRAVNGGSVLFNAGSPADVAAALPNLTGGTLSGNVFSATLTGGSWYIGPNSDILFSNAASTFSSDEIRIVKIDADVTLDGANSRILGTRLVSENFDSLVALAAVGGEGTLTLLNGRILSPVGGFLNAGKVVVKTGSALTLTNPLVSRYTGDGTAADALGRNNGTASAGVTYVSIPAGQTDQAGQAFNFHGGADVVTVPDSASIDSPAFTVTGWINPQGTQAGNAVVLSKGYNNVVDAYDVSFSGTTGNLAFRLYGAAFITTTTPITLNAWTQFVATFDGLNQRLFINGVEVGTGVKINQGLTYINGNNLLIGNGLARVGFKGYVDDVSFHNRALTPTELAAFNPSAPLVYRQTAGMTSVNGALIETGDTVQLDGGTLKGTGTIFGNVINSSGIVAPGNSPGFIDITGNYTQGSGGTLSLEFAGRDPNIPQYDRLRMTGTATLDGTIAVTLLDNFQPAPGDLFQVITSAGRTGQFATLNVPSPGGAARRLAPLYDSLGLTFQVQLVPPLNFGYATLMTGATGTFGFTPWGVSGDSAGNAYVSGDFTGTVDFDGTGPAAPVTVVDTSVFVAKSGPTGALLWLRVLTTNVAGSGDIASGNALDRGAGGNNDLLVMASTNGDSTLIDGLTGATLASFTGSLSYLFRFNTAGGLVWSDALALSGAMNGVAVGPGGTAYVAGNFNGPVDFDPGAGVFTLTSVAVGDGFVWAVNRSGNFVAAAQLSGGASDFVQAKSIAVARGAGGDDVWVTGGFFGTTSGLANLGPSAGSQDIFVLKLRPSGTTFTTQFAQAYGGAGNDYGWSIATDTRGNALISGSFSFAVNFDPTPQRSFTMISAEGLDIFVLKLADDGSFVWARAIGGYGTDVTWGVSTDPGGGVYFAGEIRGDRVNLDPAGGGTILEAATGQSFVETLDSAGKFVWAVPLDGNSATDSRARAMATDATGRVYLVGNFQAAGTVDFDPGAGVVNKTVAAGDGFLWEFSQKTAPVATLVGLPPAASVGQGTPLALGVSVTDADSVAFTYAWTVTLGTASFGQGAGPVFSAYLTTPGVYNVTIVVTDESGNTGTATAAVSVVNTAPVFNPVTFAPATKTPNSAPGLSDQFGNVIAVGGGFIAVGASKDDVGAIIDAGSDSFYNAVSGAFVRLVNASVPAAAALFGASVAFVGGFAVVGAPGEAGGGKVYVVNLSNGTVTLTIPDPGGTNGDRFGEALAALGNLLIVGAPGKTTAVGATVGEAYLYDPSTGLRLQTYANPTPAVNDEFGAAVAAVGAEILVGSPGDDAAALDAGAVDVFDPSSGKILTELQNPNASFTGGRFGAVLAASGTRALVGASLDNSAGATAGGAFLYNLDPASASFGSLPLTLRSPNATPANGRFGKSIAFSGNRAVIGADGDGTTLANSGSAFLFDLDPGSATYGTSLTTFKAITPFLNDQFGGAVAFVGTDVVVAAPLDDTGAVDSGAFYRFGASGLVSQSAAGINENGIETISGSFADPGTGDSHTVVTDWGEGAITRVALAAGTDAFTASHQYLNNTPTGQSTGIDNVRVKVLDAAADVLSANPATATFVRYDGASNVSLGNFLASGATAVAVGPDGDVYVSATGGGATPVLRFDGMTGSLLGPFIAAGSQGTTSASNLEFGPDGNLYYADNAGNRVLRFDGRSGAFLGQFVVSSPGDDVRTRREPLRHELRDQQRAPLQRPDRRVHRHVRLGRLGARRAGGPRLR